MNCAIDHIRKNGTTISLQSEWLENTEQISETQEKEIRTFRYRNISKGSISLKQSFSNFYHNHKQLFSMYA